MKERATTIFTGWLSKYRSSLFLKNLSSVLIIDVLARLSGILLLPVYLTLMSQEDYGLYNYILSIVATFSVVLNFGLYVSQSKYYSDTHIIERRRVVLFNVALLLTSLLIVFIVPVYLAKLDYYFIKLLFKNDIDYAGYRWPILIAVIVSVYTVILSNFFMTSERLSQFRKYNIVRLVLVNLVAVAALWYYNHDKIIVRLLYTYIMELIILTGFFTIYLKEMSPVFDGKIMMSAFKLGIPVMFAAIWGLIGSYSDKFFLEKYGTAKDLSYYYLAFSIANVVYLVCTSVQNVWLPRFLKEKDIQKNIRETRKMIRRLTLGLVALSLLALAAFYIAIKLSIISEAYWKTIYILPLLLAAQIINGIVLLYSNYMIYFEKTHWSLFVGIFTSTLGAVGSYLLIPRYNVYGAAFVYLSVQVGYFCIYHLLIKYKLKTVQLNLEANNESRINDML